MFRFLTACWVLMSRNQLCNKTQCFPRIVSHTVYASGHVSRMTEVWVTSLGTEFVETDFSVKSISQGHSAYDAKRYFAAQLIQFLKIMTHKRLMVFFRFIGVPDLKNFLSEVDHSNPALGSVECVTSYIEKTKPNHTREFFLFLFAFSFEQ